MIYCGEFPNANATPKQWQTFVRQGDWPSPPNNFRCGNSSDV